VVWQWLKCRGDWGTSTGAVDTSGIRRSEGVSGHIHQGLIPQFSAGVFSSRSPVGTWFPFSVRRGRQIIKELTPSWILDLRKATVKQRQPPG
jgi:hypothetical protein